MVAAVLRQLPGKEKVEEHIGPRAAQEIGERELGGAPVGAEQEEVERMGEVLGGVSANRAVGRVLGGDRADGVDERPGGGQLHDIFQIGVGEEERQGDTERRPGRKAQRKAPALLQRNQEEDADDQQIDGEYAPVEEKRSGFAHRPPPP